jgi:hypothetical protein
MPLTLSVRIFPLHPFPVLPLSTPSLSLLFPPLFPSHQPPSIPALFSTSSSFPLPLTYFYPQAGIVRLKVVVLKDVQNKASHERSSQMACEAAGAIRTVNSLTREQDCWQIYSHALDAPMRTSNRIAVWSNLIYSFTQALSFFVISLIL